jgi:hypothetical protein
VAEFVEWFPGMTLEQARMVLEHAARGSAAAAMARVRILFDQGRPAPLRRSLAGHGVSTAAESERPRIRAATAEIQAAVAAIAAGAHVEVMIA